jgi:hypothetical protein
MKLARVGPIRYFIIGRNSSEVILSSVLPLLDSFDSEPLFRIFDKVGNTNLSILNRASRERSGLLVLISQEIRSIL